MTLFYDLYNSINGNIAPSENQENQIINKLIGEISTYKDNYDSQLSLNRSLYLLYKIHFNETNSSKGKLERSPFIYSLRVQIEDCILNSIISGVDNDLISNIPKNNEKYPEYLLQYIDGHKAKNHNFYTNLLPKHANFDQLRYYFSQETTMDVNTDDFLALLQVGCPKSVKIEISRNYWDEMGRGKPERIHGVLFEKIFSYLDINPDIEIEDISLEALLCGNMQILVAIYRKYFGYGSGFFFVSEYMASERFQNAMDAWIRLELDPEGLVYHKLHIPLDVVHANNWMNNVILPHISLDINAKKDIFIGSYIRLETSLMYLNMLENNFNKI